MGIKIFGEAAKRANTFKIMLGKFVET